MWGVQLKCFKLFYIYYMMTEYKEEENKFNYGEYKDIFNIFGDEEKNHAFHFWYHMKALEFNCCKCNVKRKDDLDGRKLPPRIAEDYYSYNPEKYICYKCDPEPLEWYDRLMDEMVKDFQIAIYEHYMQNLFLIDKYESLNKVPQNILDGLFQLEKKSRFLAIILKQICAEKKCEELLNTITLKNVEKNINNHLEEIKDH